MKRGKSQAKERVLSIVEHELGNRKLVDSRGWGWREKGRWVEPRVRCESYQEVLPFSPLSFDYWPLT